MFRWKLAGTWNLQTGASFHAIRYRRAWRGPETETPPRHYLLYSMLVILQINSPAPVFTTACSLMSKRGLRFGTPRSYDDEYTFIWHPSREAAKTLFIILN